MNTTDPAPGAESAPADPSADEPSRRGTLEVHPSVVRKVAERAADRTDGVQRSPRTLTGSAGSTAKISGSGGEVDVALDLALRYPSPVRTVSDEVRRTVTAEVHRITGYRVRAVRITVAALLPEPRLNRVE